MRKNLFVVLAFALMIAVTGCSTDNPVSNIDSDASALNSTRSVDGQGPITYAIELVEAEYDVSLNQTTFTYEVTSNPNDGPAISHWDIAIGEDCGGSEILISSNDSQVEFSDPDPTTGVRGIKFDTGYDDQEVRLVTVTLAGQWSTGEVTIAVKAGNGYVLGTTQGPVCGGGGGDDEDDPTYAIYGVVFLDWNMNGVQDAGEEGIEGVSVTLSDSSVVYTGTDGSYLFDELLPGDYTVSFETPDDHLPTTATEFEVTIVDQDVEVNAGFVPVYDVYGVAFFDINGDGLQGADEPGIPGVVVTLTPGSSMTTDANGSYLFEDNFPGDYNVSFVTPEGMNATTSTSVDFAIVDADVEVNAGFALDFEAICGQTADGFTIGYWKNNLSKALSGKNKGVQVAASDLYDYTNLISDFAIEPFDGITMSGAVDVLSANGSDAIVLLSKQLLGSEYNYANGAYIGGNEQVTYFFLYYGEYVIKHAGEFSRDEILNAKDWYDAYNNSHGGAIVGPDCE